MPKAPKVAPQVAQPVKPKAVTEKIFVIRTKSDLPVERTYRLVGRKLINGHEYNELHSSDGQVIHSDDEQFKAEMEEVK